MSVEATILSYVEAWVNQDTVERAALLESCWADDGVYQDPRNRAEGRRELGDLIAGFQQRAQGARILLTSGVDEHHGMVRFAWAMLDPSGRVSMEGFDVGERGADGRLQRITGFFGPFPQAPDSWPERLVYRSSGAG